jgi:F-type H+-transporting ATPase subunit alpha
LRLDLAQYRELQAFAQFASDLDEVSRKQLERGQRMVEVLKQPPYSPIPAEKQALVIFAGNEGFLDSLAVGAVVQFEAELYPFIEASYPQILENIRSTSKIDDETMGMMKKALEEFKATFVAK